MASRAARRWADPPEGRSKIWRGIRFAKRFSLEDLAQISGQDYSHVRKYCAALVEAGYLRLTDKAKTNEPGSVNRYRLVRDSGPLPPMPRQKGVVWDPNDRSEFEMEPTLSQRDRAWQLIREQREFGVPDLVRAGIARKTVQKFVGVLRAVGYLSVIEPANGRALQSTVYRLTHDSGPLAPVVQRDGTVWDRNLDQILKGGGHVG